jgi:hypothetical protein
MNEDNNNLHQLHINIPKESYAELKVILPQTGMITSLIRSFLLRYIKAHKEYRVTGKSPSDVAVEGIVDDVVKKGWT